MAEKSQKAAEAVERLFKRKPDANLDEFLDAAAKADSSIDRGMDKRSFNAIYVLPLKRKASSKSKSKGKAKKTTRRKSGKRGGRRKRASRSGPSAAARAVARQLVLERDQKVLETLGGNGDPQKAYDLAAEVDAYIDRLHGALKK